MSGIELDEASKQQLIARLKRYAEEELAVELGGFDAQFLLDFFAEQMGCYYYNQGLADALKAMTGKLDECSELVFELEKSPP
jgi:uncharacterized protein (DUF2164 family)